MLCPGGSRRLRGGDLGAGNIEQITKKWQTVLPSGLERVLSSHKAEQLSAVRTWLPGAGVTAGHLPGSLLMGRVQLRGFHSAAPHPLHPSLLKMPLSGLARWLSCWHVVLYAKRLCIQFRVRAHTQVAGSIPSWQGTFGRQQINVFFSHRCFVLFCFVLKILFIYF